jgi:hypothetical protein
VPWRFLDAVPPSVRLARNHRRPKTYTARDIEGVTEVGE